MSTNIIDDTINDNDKEDDDDDDQQQQSVKTKIIKCKTNNQQNSISSYNILTPNGSSSSSTVATRSIDVPNEHASIKLHIRRVYSPSSNELTTIHPTTNLLSQQSNDFNDQQLLPLPLQLPLPQPTTTITTTTKIISRKFFNSDELINNKNARRLIGTRRKSLLDIDQSQSSSSSSIYDISKPIINNHINIYDENSLKKPTTITKTHGNKRKFTNEQQEKKRTKLTSRTIKQLTNNNSRSSFLIEEYQIFQTNSEDFREMINISNCLFSL